MPKLRRMRLVSIGHSDSRYADVTLKFTDRHDRPTNSVLWLRNGGGKTQLLGLFFAGLRPNKREFLGQRAEQRVRSLDHCVAKQDHGLVVCEWELDADKMLFDNEPLTYLTGVFYEWPSSAKDNGKAGVDRLFFAMKSSDEIEALSLDGLPIYTGENRRHRRHLKGFQRQLAQLDKAHPQHEVFFDAGQNKFMAELASHGLDPEVFRYQIRMNEREGGASELFSFAQDAEFIDFLLEMAFSQQKADDVREQLSTFREELVVRNEQLKPERECCDGLITRLNRLLGVQRERDRVFNDTASSHRRLLALKRWVTGRIQTLIEEQRSLQTTCQESQHEANAARNRADAVHREAAVHQRAACQMRFDKIDAELQVAKRRHAESLRLKNIWLAARPLARCWDARRQAKLYREQLARKRTQYAPDLARLVETASGLAAALAHEANSARVQEQSRKQAAEQLRAEARQLQQRAQAEGEAAARQETEANQLVDKLKLADTELQLLQSDGCLNPDERAESGRQRLGEAITAETDRIQALNIDIDDNHDSLDALQQKRAEAEQSATQQRQRLDQLSRDLSLAQEQRREIERDAALLRLLQTENVDVETAGAAAMTAADEELRRITETILRIRVEAAEDERAMQWLRGDGELLPPSQDVQAALEWLTHHNITAWSGWEYIESNYSPSERRATVQRLPFVATGIIVASKDYDRVVELAIGDGTVTPLPLRTAVTIVPTEALSDASELMWTVVGPKSDAHFDKGAAAIELNQLETRFDERNQEVNAHKEWQHKLNALREKLRAFQAKYPAGWFARHAQKIEAADARHQETLAQVDRLNREKTATQSRLAEALDKREKARSAKLALQRHLDHVETFIRQFATNVAQWHRDLEKAQQQAQQHRANQQHHGEQENANSELAKQQDEEATSARLNSSQLDGEIGRLRYVDDASVADYAKNFGGEGPVNQAVPLGSLRTDYESLLREYENKVNSETLEQLASDRDLEAAKERTEFERVIGQFADIALQDVEEELGQLPSHKTANVRSEEADREEHRAMVKAGNLGNKLRPRRDALKQAVAECGELAQTGDLPSVRSLASDDLHQQEADRLKSEANELRQLAEEFDAELKRLNGQLTAAQHEADNLEARQTHIATVESSYQELFERADCDVSTDIGAVETDSLNDQPITVSDAKDLARQLSEGETSLRRLIEQHRELDVRRDSEANQITKWSRQTRFTGLSNSVSRQFAEKTASALETKSEFFIQQLQDRALEIERKLEEADQHHERVVNIVAAAVDEGLTLLRRVERMSKLPDSLPQAGKHFLKIDTKASDNPAERRARIADLIAELIQSGDIGDGLSLVQKGVRRVAVHTKVRVLHPDLRSTKRLSMSELQRKSDGERLTCAILLYCALLRLRRQSGNKQGSGVLVLDNPIGTASRISFIDMQREVAESMNVQLIYATGVKDFNAVGALENVISLKNSRVDRRTNRRIVEVERDGEWVGEVDAARIVFDTPPGSIVGAKSDTVQDHNED